MIIKQNIILLILIIGGIKSETCENISHQWLTNAFKIGSHIKTHNFVQLILDAIETFHIIDRAYNNCESLGEFYEMNYSQLNDEGQLCIEGLFNEYDWVFILMEDRSRQMISWKKFFKKMAQNLEKVPITLDHCSRIGIRN